MDLLRAVRGLAYGRGYRPKPGSIFFSPSLDIVYAFKDAYTDTHKDYWITYPISSKEVRRVTVSHDEICDANGCRCGTCPCLGPPLCVDDEINPRD